MIRKVDESVPESDCFVGAVHPRETMELFGHDGVEQEFLEAFRTGRLPQAWLIGGREGIGKATFAWRAARFVLSYPDPLLPTVKRAQNLSTPEDQPAVRRIIARSHPDVSVLRREWDTKTKKHYTEIRVDDVRKTIGMFQRSAGEGGWRVAIVDSADDMNKSGANALLKMIEEPPPRCLFFILAHQPGRLLPTIRSRCRKVMMQSLPESDVIAAIRAQGDEWAQRSDDEVQRAAHRAGGSVLDAMRLMTQGSLSMVEKAEAQLARLPAIDWRRVHELAASVQGREGLEGFETLLATTFEWIDRTARENAGLSDAPRRLANLAQVWEKIAVSARETQTFNLDRRPLVLMMFSDLSEAVRALRA